jgi:hypothetical protein
MALALFFSWIVRHLDVKTAFLYADIFEELFMKPMPWDNAPPGWGYLVKKSLYGYRKAPRNWNKHITKAIKSIGFTQSLLDSCLFYRWVDGLLFLILVYVDDILIFGRPGAVLDDIVTQIQRQYETTDNGAVTRFLGIRIKLVPGESLDMDQTEYVEEVAERYSGHWRIFKDGEVTGPLPMDAYNVALNPWTPPEDSVASMWFASFPYRQLVGALLWLMLNTRPDLAHAVTFCARWSQKPTYGACYVLCYLMAYVVSTKERGLRFARPSCLDIHAITDAALGADPIKRRSLGAWNIFGCAGR